MWRTRGLVRQVPVPRPVLLDCILLGQWRLNRRLRLGRVLQKWPFGHASCRWGFSP